MTKWLCLLYRKASCRSDLFGVTAFLIMASVILLGGAFVSTTASALSYSHAVDVSFDFNPTISVSLSSADLIISELAPGSVADSNTITVGVSTNASFGYTLSANVGNDTRYDTRSLIRADEDTSEFASIATDAAMSTITTDNAWGFSSKLTTDGASWANYSGLPLYSDTENTKTILETSSPQDINTVDFKIAAKAANTIVAGEYRNVINFIAVAKPEPAPTPIECSNKAICYSINALDNAEGSMANQGSVNANASVTLRASNYSRSGYGFAGWNTAPDYSGVTYGPNQTIQAPADMSHGLALYAVWVPSKGLLQDWEGCVGLNKGDVTALTDARDNDTYAVAKLADGRCWMIENLRIDADATRTESQRNLAQGYGGSFAGLADAEEPWARWVKNDNSLYFSGTKEDGSTATIDIGTNNYPEIRFPRYNNYNTFNRADPMNSTDANIYSYGNYYTWAAAIANTSVISDSSTGVTATAICPKGWRLPKGSNSTNVANNEYWNLIVNGINHGVAPTLYLDSDTNKLYPYYQASIDGSTVFDVVRSYPNNFIYSGILYNNNIGSRGYRAYYWTSTPSLPGAVYNLELAGSGVVRPGTIGDVKGIGGVIRCIKDGS